MSTRGPAAGWLAGGRAVAVLGRGSSSRPGRAPLAVELGVEAAERSAEYARRVFRGGG